MVFNNESKLLSKMDEDDDLFKKPQAQQKTNRPMIVIQTGNGQKVAMNPEECSIY